MNFSTFCILLKKLEHNSWMTITGKPFSYSLREESIVFTPENGDPKSLGLEKFERYYNLYFTDGKKERRYFTNNTGNSINGRTPYFLPLFKSLEEKIAQNKK